MRVLHVAETAKGGVGTYLRELLPLQASAFGHGSVRAIVPASHAGQLGPALDPLLVRFDREARGRAAMQALARTLRREVATFRPEMIHAHSTFAGLVVRALYGWRRDRPRIVYCPHGWSFDMAIAGWKQSAAAGVERALGLFCDRVIAVSRHEEAAGRAIGIAAAKLELVPNGLPDIAPAAPSEWRDERLKLLFVGRFDRQKGADTLIDAVEPLQHRIALRVAGEAVVGGGRALGPVAEELGWLSPAGLRAELAAADVVAVPSRWEAFGLVAIEAMRAGRMVVASDVGGLREIVADGETGWLVPPDSPALLGERLRAIRRGERDRMGQAGRRRFLDHFMIDGVHRRLAAIYDDCLVPARVAA